MQNKKVQYKMENNEFKKVHIKNDTGYYFDDLDNILTDEKSHKNILIYNISYKTLIDSKPFRIRFDKINGFIRIYDGTRYVTLFGSDKYGAIYDNVENVVFSEYFNISSPVGCRDNNPELLAMQHELSLIF